jgi:hypothetical protein
MPLAQKRDTMRTNTYEDQQTAPDLKIFDQIIIDTGSMDLLINDGITSLWFTFSFEEVHKESKGKEESMYYSSNREFEVIVHGTTMGELNDAVTFESLCYA